MQWLSRLSVRRPVFATVMILLIVVVGAVGYRTLGVDKFPKIDFPTDHDRHAVSRRVAVGGRDRRLAEDRGCGQLRPRARRR